MEHVRLQNFLTYRIAATLQLVFFFFIALIAFDPRDYEPASVAADPEAREWPDFFFLPVILLILITLLNDGTMIAIGYDNVIAPTRPAKVRVLSNPDPPTLRLPRLHALAQAAHGARARAVEP